jgi:hypothetical protein
MLFNKTKAKAAFEVAQRIKEHKDLYCLAADKIPVSIDDLAYVVSDMYGLRIEVNDVDFQAEFIRGMVERFKDGSARISIRREMSKDLKRFVTAKELCQLAISTDDDWSTEGTKTLEAMAFSGTLANGGQYDPAKFDLPVQSEYLAEIAAYEVLYPHEFRAHDRSELASGARTLKSLANHYDVPVFVVSSAIGERFEAFRRASLA